MRPRCQTRMAGRCRRGGERRAESRGRRRVAEACQRPSGPREARAFGLQLSGNGAVYILTDAGLGSHPPQRETRATLMTDQPQIGIVQPQATDLNTDELAAVEKLQKAY